MPGGGGSGGGEEEYASPQNSSVIDDSAAPTPEHVQRLAAQGTPGQAAPQRPPLLEVTMRQPNFSDTAGSPSGTAPLVPSHPSLQPLLSHVPVAPDASCSYHLPFRWKKMLKLLKSLS